MIITRLATPALSRRDFVDDAHAAKYLAVLDGAQGAFSRLLDILNDSAVVLVHESQQARPALRAVVGDIEADPMICAVIAGPEGLRFRQAVGVAVKLRMRQLGWAPTRTKGSVSSRHFKTAERYVPATTDDDYADRVSRGLDRLVQIGTDAERRESDELLMAALRRTRADEGRPF